MKAVVALVLAAMREKRIYIAPFPDGTEIYVVCDAGPFTGKVEDSIAPDVYVHGYTEALHGAYGVGWHLKRDALSA
ncbi:MAG: hypothetical protein LBN00_06370 [Oscillospiraceae bacterium]|nr:hypothetical protein [Oscillospiraceae bacterium]